MEDTLVKIGLTVLGVVLGQIVNLVVNRRRFRKELRDNNHIDVTGSDWHAAWQTSVDHSQVINTERLRMKQKGATVQICNLEKSPENPKGGYLWEGQMQFFHGRALMGWYFPRREENNTSRGILYLTYQSPRKMFFGKWVGSAFDGDLSSGFVVISRDRSESLSQLQDLVAAHPQKINILATRID